MEDGINTTLSRMDGRLSVNERGTVTRPASVETEALENAADIFNGVVWDGKNDYMTPWITGVLR